MKYLFTILTTTLLIFLLMGGMLLISSSMANKYGEKSSPFECGFLGYEESRSPFSVHFFMVALIFLVFDVELILMFPFLPALTYQISLPMYLMVIGFVSILLIGLVVEWEKSMLEWQN